MKKRKKSKIRRGGSKSRQSKKQSNTMLREVNVLETRQGTFVVTKNLLYNMVVRDASPINASFDKHYGSQLTETDELFSEVAFTRFVVTRADIGLHEDYNTVLTGLLANALNTFGASVVLLRNGLPGQSMVLIRQVIEICSTIIHICSDPKAQAIKDFREGRYQSTASMGQSKKAVPIIGMFWGFLSNTYVHINDSHSKAQAVRPYEADDADVIAVITCLRMAAWICYITAELAFPTARKTNRYWKLRDVGEKSAVAYDPSDAERKWAAKFLNLSGVGPDDFGVAQSDL